MAHRTIRSDGWTPVRQLAFLQALAGTRSVTAAARAAGMSRESAHRLRGRPESALFAHLWELALAPTPHPLTLLLGKGHSRPLPDGRLTRLLSSHFRRERGDFSGIGDPGTNTLQTRPTGT